MATISRRKFKTKTSYVAQVRRKGFQTVVRSFSTKEDATKWARSMERRFDQGSMANFSEAGRVTIGDLCKQYIVDGKHLHKKGKDIEALRAKYIQKFPIAKISLLGLSMEKIAEFRDQRCEQVSNTTWNKDLSFLNVVVAYALNDLGFYIPHNPLKNVKRLKEPKPRDRILVNGEYDQLINKCSISDNPYLLPMVKLSIETAIRQGELLSLNYAQVNFEKCTLELTKTKNGYARTVPLSTEAIEIIKQLPRRMDGKLFPLTKSSLSFWFKQALRRAGIKEFRWHDLRRTACSLLFEKGLSVPEVQLISGHRDPRLLLNTYTKLNPVKVAKKLA